MSSRVAPPQLRQIGEPRAEYLKSVAQIQNVLCSILTLPSPVNQDLLGQEGYWVCYLNPTCKFGVFDTDRPRTLQEKLNVAQLLG